MLIENTVSGFCLQRHPNDIKFFNGLLPSLLEHGFENVNITYDENAYDFIVKSEHSNNDKPFQKMNPR